jgi:hypothetical protein
MHHSVGKFVLLVLGWVQLLIKLGLNAAPVSIVARGLISHFGDF